MASFSSSIPLLSDDTVEAAQLNLEALSRGLAALREGKLPTTDQFQRMVQHVLHSEVLSESGSRFTPMAGQLSVPGRKVVRSLRSLIEAILRVTVEKNHDDLLQRFLYAASQAEVDVKTKIETPSLALPSTDELEKVTDSLKDLLSALLSSSELRRILQDSVHLVRDFFASSAENLANASISVTKASKKASKVARVEENERAQGLTGLENVKIDASQAKAVKKKVSRAIEDSKDETLQRLQKKRDEVLQYVDEGLPSDAKDVLIERFKAILNEIQSDPSFEDAVSSLLNLVKKYATLNVDAVVDAAQATSVKVEKNAKVDTAGSLFREIIESFTGDLTPVFKAFDAVIKDFQSDQAIELLHKVDRFIGRSLHDPGFVTSARAQRRFETILDSATDLLTENPVWKTHLDKLSETLTAAFDNVQNDAAVANLERQVEKFGLAAKQFGLSTVRLGEKKLDGLGSISDLFKDVTQVILPRLFKIVRSIPLPRVEYSSAEFDLALDNVVFTSESFLPTIARFENHIDLAVKKGYAAYATTASNTSTIYIAGLKLKALDISYYINKKSRWITIEDAGLLDIVVGGAEEESGGLDIVLTVENAKDEDQESFFTLTDVQVTVDGFAISIHDSQHPIRNFFAKPALRTYIEAQFVSTMTEIITTGFKSLDTEFFKIQQRAIGVSHASPDLASYLQALVTIPFASIGSSDNDVVSTGTGFTKVSKDGDSILAIGVSEDLLPGKLTGLGRQGKDVVARKKGLEILAEEGRNSYENAAETVGGIVDDIETAGERLGNEFESARAKEAGKGWRSDVFDF